MTTETAKSCRGVTLVELMVALAVSAAVMVGVVAAVQAQQQAYYNGHKTREAQGAGRTAFLVMERALRRAGYGMDPALALDFNFYGTDSEPFPDGDALCPTQMGGCPRDSTGNADELVFYSRDPKYWLPSNPGVEPRGSVWRLLTRPASGANGANQITVEAHQGDRFLRGQILQAVCADGNVYAYFTVSNDFPANSPTTQVAANGTSAQLTLFGTSASDPFRRQDLVTTDCSPPNALVFKIDRYRFHVRPWVVSAGPPAEYDPYLVLDMGVDLSGNGSVGPEDELLIAEGIEQMQVAYVLANPALASVGDGSPGTAITFTDEDPGANPPSLGATAADTIYKTAYPASINTSAQMYSKASWYGYNSTDPQRSTNNQANIRMVRIAVITRSSTPDLASSTPIAMTNSFTLYNQQGAPTWITQNANRGAGWDGYQRVRMETTVPLPNMVIRGMTAF